MTAPDVRSAAELLHQQQDMRGTCTVVLVGGGRCEGLPWSQDATLCQYGHAQHHAPSGRALFEVRPG